MVLGCLSRLIKQAGLPFTQTNLVLSKVAIIEKSVKGFVLGVLLCSTMATTPKEQKI